MRRGRKENLIALLVCMLCVIGKAGCSGEDAQPPIKFTEAVSQEESQSQEKTQSSETDTKEEETAASEALQEMPAEENGLMEIYADGDRISVSCK